MNLMQIFYFCLLMTAAFCGHMLGMESSDESFCERACVMDVKLMMQLTCAAHEEIMAYTIAMKKEYATIPNEWHAHVANYIYALKFAEINAARTGVDDSKEPELNCLFDMPHVYYVSDGVRQAFKTYKQEDDAQDDTNYRHSKTCILLNSGHLYCYVMQRWHNPRAKRKGGAFGSLTCKNIIDVACDQDSVVYVTTHERKMFSIDIYKKSSHPLTCGNANMTTSVTPQKKNSFMVVSKNGTTFVWDNHAAKKVGNVQFKLGLFQDLEVLFCSQTEGLILYWPAMELIYVFEGNNKLECIDSLYGSSGSWSCNVLDKGL